MARLTQRLTTTVGAHGLADRVALYGQSLGLSVTHDKAGGWFEKDHVIEAVGDETAVRKLMAAIRAMA